MASSSDDGGDGGDLIRWGIVGLGDVCAVKAGPAFWKCRGSTLAAVMRRTPGAAREWIESNAARLPPDVRKNVRAYDSVERMVKETALDAIYVASPPGAHLENVRQIAAAVGDAPNSTVRAVYVEKPCGRCAWETRAIVGELRARGVEFYPAYVSRAHERTRVLRKMLGEDRVCGDRVTRVKYTQRGSGFARGLEVTDGSVPWRLDAARSGGGLIVDMGCHVLDRMDYLFGPLEDVRGDARRKGASSNSKLYPLVENYVEMTARVGDCDWAAIPAAGAAVECVWDFSPGAGDADELSITGPGGSVRMAGMGAGLPIEVLDVDGKPVRAVEFESPEHAAQPLIQAVVDELRGIGGGGGEDRPARSPAQADNAIRTSEVLDAILGSYYGGRHDEFWSRPNTWPGLKVQP
ncbi:hypothetical protein ACHAWF_002047 [Thalassiosira exigua]